MIGILDVGGGMRGVFSAGVYDYLTDEKITFPYHLGISAGAGNLVSFVTGQRGRNYKYYAEYSFRKEYMSLGNFLRKGSYIDLHYIYSTMCNKGGENPIDYDAFVKNSNTFYIAATTASNGEMKYFTENDLQQDNYKALMASCCIPAVCKPITIDGVEYFDGGVGIPIPYNKPFEDGCDKLVVVLTRPVDVPHKPQSNKWLVKFLLRKYPAIYNLLETKDIVYNQQIKDIVELEKQGKILIVAPLDTYGVDTLSNDKEAMKKLYDHGYEQAKKIKDFIN